jgi:hypothetical protein
MNLFVCSKNEQPASSFKQVFNVLCREEIKWNFLEIFSIVSENKISPMCIRH